MSTILKALKKLEERKAADGRRQGDIAWDILKEKHPEESRLRVWPLAVIGVVVAVCVGLVGYLLTRISQDAVETFPAVSTQVVVKSQGKSSSEPIVLNRDKVNPEQNKSEPESLVGMTLTGIAFHDDPQSRLAIVNDLPVMVGTVIDGFVVEEIHSDRVFFSRQGERFLLRLKLLP